METLKNETEVTSALQESIDLLTKNDDELIKVLSVTIAQRGEDYLRDQGLIRNCLRRIQALKNEVADLKGRNAHSEAYLDIFLCEQEEIFNRTGRLESVEIATAYCAAAKHREQFGRTNHYAKHVQEWIDSPDSLPFGQPKTV